jgi:hypothetical protein
MLLSTANSDQCRIIAEQGRHPVSMGWQGQELRQEAKKTRSQKETREETS